MYKKLFLLTAMFGLMLSLTFASTPVLAQSGDTQGGDIVVQTIPGPTIAEKIAVRTKTSWSWYIVRGSGLVAAVALVILMLSGIGQVTGYTFRFLEPITAWASHRALGLAFGVSVFIHMFGLLFDHFVSFNIWQVLVPWLSEYQPVTIFNVHLGSLYVAFGVLAFYAVVLIILTSVLWVEKKPRLWKFIHLLSYFVILLVFVHALYIGTDLTHGILHWLWILSGVGVAWACLHRLRRAKTT